MKVIIPDTEELNGTEIVQIYGSSQLTTVQTIANLGKNYGSGLEFQRIILSGSSDTAPDTNTYVGWNSGTAANKTSVIPESTGSLNIMIISDLYGNAGTYTITAVPIIGSIIGLNEVYTDYGSINLLDTTAGWVSF